MTLTLTESTAEEREALDERLVAFNRKSVPFTQAQGDWIDLSHTLKSDAGEVIAGINATMYCWKVVYVDVLFVDEAHRGKGYGRQLVQAMEAKAKGLGGYLAHLDTFDWQAKDFYERCGYATFGVLDNCPPGHKRTFMKKDL